MAGGRLAKWSCHQLECLAEFIQAYGDSLKSRPPQAVLVEPYATPAACQCKEAECAIDSLEARLLKGKNPFSRIILLAKTPDEAASIEAALKPLDKKHAASVISGSAIRESVMRRLFDLIPRSSRSLALVNPPGYASLRWSVIKKLAQHGADWQGHKIDLCLIFPVEMALLRNLSRRECQNSINRLYGDENWQAIRQRHIERKLDLDQTRRELVELYKAQLKTLGYKHVDDAEPARFTSPPYYHVIWASDRASRAKELREVWGRERYLPCEMFH